jgi:hypothetical protein
VEWKPLRKFGAREDRKRVQEVVGAVHMMVPALVVVVVVEVEVGVGVAEAAVVVEELEVVVHK